MSERDQRWTIRFDDFQPDDERRREALLALGNGLLSWRASAPEAAFTQQASSPHYAGFYRAGWYDHAERVVNGETVRLAALVNLPDPFGLAISLDGQQWFDAAQLAQSDYRQCLRMDRAQLERELSFVLGESRCRLREVRLLSLADPDLALLRWELEVSAGIERVWVRTLLDGGVRNQLVEKNRAYEGARLCEVRMQADEAGRVGLSARVATPGRRLAMAVQTHCDAAGLRWRTRQEQSRVVQMAECGLDGTRRLVIEKRVVVQVDDALVEPPEAAIRQVLARLPGERFWLLHLRHARAWRRLWTRMPLALGDPPLERALRLHAFHLLQTISPQSLGHDIGFPPRGWQEGYFGQVFWDEVFAFAFLGMHFPALARQLLRYRHRHLDGARERARQAGLRGAMFPWRSADDGQEQTPPYQCNPLSGRWMADHTYRQRHIGAAIAHDAWQLYLATGDETLLANEAGELILEIARFWASLARRDAASGRYMIRGVIGPDEYHNLSPVTHQPGLDNNAYTNLMAVWTLTLGLQVLDSLPSGTAAALRQRLQLSDTELDIWRDITRSMYLPIRADGVLAQFDDAEQLERAPDAWRAGDRPRLDWMLEARGDRADDYRLAKQADVLMLLYLFPPPALQELLQALGYGFDQQALRRTAAFHLGNITHESSLSTVVCAGALACFDPQTSWDYFQQSMGVDLNAPSGGGTQEGIHLGAMAGSLDVLQRHYLGIRPGREWLDLFPAPPPALGEVRLAVRYRGAGLQVLFRGGELRVRAAAENARAIAIRHPGGHRRLAPGEVLTVRCAGA